MVEFTSLQFTVSGTASKSVDETYFIEFVCDGVSSGIFPVNVLSTIAAVNWVVPPPTQVFVKTDSLYDLSVLLQVTDNSNNGIQGKIPRSIQILPSQNVKFRSRNDLSIFQPSAQDGIINVFIKITQLNKTIDS